MKNTLQQKITKALWINEITITTMKVFSFLNATSYRGIEIYPGILEGITLHINIPKVKQRDITDSKNNGSIVFFTTKKLNAKERN